MVDEILPEPPGPPYGITPEEIAALTNVVEGYRDPDDVEMARQLVQRLAPIVLDANRPPRECVEFIVSAPKKRSYAVSLADLRFAAQLDAGLEIVRIGFGHEHLTVYVAYEDGVELPADLEDQITTAVRAVLRAKGRA